MGCPQPDWGYWAGPPRPVDGPFAQNPEAAWRASGRDLLAAGLEIRWVEQILAERPRLDPDAEWTKLEKARVRVLVPGDAEYPARLSEIHGAPPLLYIRGTLTAGDDLALAVVGTRRPSAYGRAVTERLVADLAAAGLTIVSGLARGIDAVAHRTALEAAGRTIAVLGSGLDIVYPSEHRALAARIADQGALLSDYPLGTQPDAMNFPARNRIISGLSRGVLITEAPAASGARITTNYALEQNREVFAVPGSILSALSETPHQLSLWTQCERGPALDGSRSHSLGGENSTVHTVISLADLHALLLRWARTGLAGHPR